MNTINKIAKYFCVTLMVVGFLVIYFGVYELFGKTAIINNQQQALKQQLTNQWNLSIPTPNITKPIPGWAIARINIPKIGKELVVVEGVQLKDIKYAPGHYPKSALPGQSGNFSMAGHRTPAIFWYLDRVVPGDLIFVETQKTKYTYEVVENIIVKPTAVYEVDPVPPGFKRGDKLLTITTCDPTWDNTHRLIVHAKLIKTEKRL